MIQSGGTVRTGHLRAAAVTDLARGLTNAKSRAAAEIHLVGCRTCKDRIGVWTQFAVASQEDGRRAPSQESVDRVLRLAERAHAGTGVTHVIAALRYDGASFPIPVGVRGAAWPEQVVYEAEGVAVDVRISRESSRRTVIVGQLTDCLEPSNRLADLPILLIDGTEVAVRGLSDARGEFHLEHSASDALRLEVALAGGRIIEVPLDNSRQRRDA